MKKFLRYTGRIAGIIICLLSFCWLALAIFLQVKKESLLQTAETQLKARFGSGIRIGKADLSLFRHFPTITLSVSDLTLRDSAWSRHHHDLLKVARLDVSCSLIRSILKRSLQIGSVYIEHGTIYFYTDSTGYTNKYLLKTPQTDSTAAGPKKEIDLLDITLSDIRWVEEKQDKYKLFDLDIRKLDAHIERDNRVLQLKIGAGGIQVNSFSFNTRKGSFMKDKLLTGHFILQYNTASKILEFDKVTVQIQGHPFVFTGRFFPTVSPDPFFLKIDTKDIRWREATALLTPDLQQKLDLYDIDRPVTVHLGLDAGSADDPMPQIQARMDLDKGGVSTPPGRFTETSFRASFTNEWIKGRKREDENSGLRLLAFSGKLENIPLRADTITITNVKHPFLHCDLHSGFALRTLNEVTGSQTLQFQKGSCQMDLFYNGPLSENDTAGATVNGHLRLDSAAITYLPYRLQLTNGNGELLFKDQDLIVDHLDIRAGKTRIAVKGVARNLIALLDHNAENVSMDWNINTPRLDLEDFIGLAGPSATVTTPGYTTNKSLLGASFVRIDHLLKEGVVRVRLEAADLSYRKFSGAHARADLLFDDHEIRLNHLTVEQGSGSLDLKAALTRHPQGDNTVSLESHVEGVDLPRMFNAFNNFGQDALTSKNLKGTLTADIRMTGALTDKAKMVTSAMKGTIVFQLKNGQLIDFEPMQKIHEFLKKKDFSEIHFGELASQLDFDSTTFTVHRIEIRSTAATLFAEGTYDLKTGPDMSLQIPLSNLKEKDPGILSPRKGNEGNAGLSLRLRARRGEDGKLRISWDPFKKALKKTRQSKT